MDQITNFPIKIAMAKEDHRNGEMPRVWIALKKSLDCKSSSDVSGQKSRNPCKSGCSTSIKNAIHGSKAKKSPPPPSAAPPSGSPRSVESNIVFNSFTHEVILSESKSELNITKPDDAGYPHSVKPRKSTAPHRRSLGDFPIFSGGRKAKDYDIVDVFGSASWVCRRCGEILKDIEAVQEHHFSKHAVSELVEGDSSRKIVEIICQTSPFKSKNNGINIETVLKIHNMQKTLTQFENYREMVKTKASRLQKKHPRCIADGNELLRFYGTTISCSLGINGCSRLCILETCGVCQIIKHGFSLKKENSNGDENSIGVFTTSTCEKAIDSIEMDKYITKKKALIVCRVIAGRIHKPLADIQEMASKTGFDSLAGKVDGCCNIEELYLLNPKALLPCFVVILST